MKRHSALGVGVLGFAWLCAVACGDDPQGGSPIDMTAGANGPGQGEGGNDGGLILDPNAGGAEQGLGGLGSGGDAS